MPYEYRFMLCAILLGAGVVYAVFSMPPLTTGNGGGGNGFTQDAFDAAFSEELSYCRRQPDALDCRCFANISGAILATNEPRVPGVRYADKQELARGQASDSC